MMEFDDGMSGIAVQISDAMLPWVEWAEGQRLEMERRGWSPAAAEDYALGLLNGARAIMFQHLLKATQ